MLRYFKKKRVIALIVVLATSFLLLGYAYLIEPCFIHTVYYEVSSENLPAEFHGTKIVWLTDPHQDTRGSFNLTEKVQNIVKAEKPDLLLFGGDYSIPNKPSLSRFFDGWKDIPAPLGKFGILGNHDYWNPHAILATMQNADIEHLDNRSLWLTRGNARIKLAGVADLWTGRPNLASLKYDLQPDDFVILLTHNPDLIHKLEDMDRQSINLALAGHSHGGQVTLFGLYAPMTTTTEQFRTGKVKPHDNEKLTVIISNGIGTSGLPIRFFAPPQVVVVTLYSTQTARQDSESEPQNQGSEI